MDDAILARHRAHHDYFLPFRVEMFVTVPRSLKNGDELSPAAKLVLARLVRYGANRGGAWPKIRTLAEELGMGWRTVQRAIDALVAAKLLKVEARQGTSNLYGTTPKGRKLCPDYDPEKPRTAAWWVPTGALRVRVRRLTPGRKLVYTEVRARIGNGIACRVRARDLMQAGGYTDVRSAEAALEALFELGLLGCLDREGEWLLLACRLYDGMERQDDGHPVAYSGAEVLAMAEETAQLWPPPTYVEEATEVVVGPADVQLVQRVWSRLLRGLGYTTEESRFTALDRDTVIGLIKIGAAEGDVRLGILWALGTCRCLLLGWDSVVEVLTDRRGRTPRVSDVSAYQSARMSEIIRRADGRSEVVDRLLDCEPNLVRPAGADLCAADGWLCDLGGWQSPFREGPAEAPRGPGLAKVVDLAAHRAVATA